jgi:hypothetical protein
MCRLDLLVYIFSLFVYLLWVFFYIKKDAGKTRADVLDPEGRERFAR